MFGGRCYLPVCACACLCQAANANRHAVPWVVAHGHRDMYCSTGDDTDCQGAAVQVRLALEPLFFK